jgi:hypothetical protein
MRERMHAEVRTYRHGDAISVVLRDGLKDASYDLPLTLKTYVPASWPWVCLRQGNRTQRMEVIGDKMRGYVSYQAVPNAETITLTAMGRN